MFDSTTNGVTMSDETENGIVRLSNPLGYDDTISQRASSLAELAALTNTISDEEIREICIVMMRKINASIKLPSTASISSIHSESYKG